MKKETSVSNLDHVHDVDMLLPRQRLNPSVTNLLLRAVTIYCLMIQSKWVSCYPMWQGAKQLQLRTAIGNQALPFI